MILLMISLFVSQVEVVDSITKPACQQNPWGVKARVAENGDCYVRYEDYDRLAQALKSVEQADLVVTIPNFRLLRDEAGRRYAKLEGDGRVYVQLGYIKKSVPLVLDGLFYVQEVTPKPQPGCLDRWYLRLAPRLGGGYMNHKFYFIGSGTGSVLLPIRKWVGLDFSLDFSLNTLLWPSWMDVRLTCSSYFIW